MDHAVEGTSVQSGDDAEGAPPLPDSWRGLGAQGGGSFVPSFEIGLRHDGSDAETGFGADIGAGVVWTDPSWGIRAELRAWGLLTHEDGSFRERGFAGSLSWDPSPDTDRGRSLTIGQTVALEALRGERTLQEIAAQYQVHTNRVGAWNRRLGVKIGYGFSAFGDRFTATPELGFGVLQDSRDYRLGWKLGLARGGPASMDLGLEATRTEPANDDAEPVHSLQVRLTTRW